MPPAERATADPNAATGGIGASEACSDQFGPMRTNTVAAPSPVAPPDGSPTIAVVPSAERANAVPKALAPAWPGSCTPVDHDPSTSWYAVTAPPPATVGSPTSAVVPSADSATVVPNADVVGGGLSAAPADQAPFDNVNTVAAPVPASPPPGSPTSAVTPSSDRATESPKSN